jgi:cytochrome c oxidase cbb3-type subunit 3
MKYRIQNTALLVASLFSIKSYAFTANDYALFREPSTYVIGILLLVLISIMFILPKVIEVLLKLVKKNKGKSLLLILTLGSLSAKAEIIDVSFYQNFDMYHTILFITAFILLLTILTQLRVIFRLTRDLNAVDFDNKKPSKLSILLNKLTGSNEIESEDDIMLDHDYDGIKELDNNLPPWWLYGFYITIIFAVVYLGHYHVFKTGDLMIAEYENDVLKAAELLEAKQASGDITLIDENNVELLTDAVSIDKGAKLYASLCATCHASEGQGLVGPNLTDAYWIHGGSFKEIFSTIKYGVPEKGMIAWKSQLSPTQIQNISSFIVSIKGTNPENPKAPEGDLVE